MNLHKNIFAGGLIAAATLAGAASADTYVKTVNAGIPGHNKETHEGVSSNDCLNLCTERSWCRSADYERAAKKCFLQPVTHKQAALRRDYPGNPFDHYSRKFEAQCGQRVGVYGKGSAALIYAARKRRAERRAKRAWRAFVGGADAPSIVASVLDAGFVSTQNAAYGLGTRYADLEKAKNVVINCEDGTVMRCIVTATPCAW